MAIHNKGGSKEPYERFHTDKKAHDDASREATKDLDGLMAGWVFAENDQQAPPEHWDDPGLPGQWAYTVEFLYYCIGPDKWVRIGLDPLVDMGWLLLEGNVNIEIAPGVLVDQDSHPYAFEQGDAPPGEGLGWYVEPFPPSYPMPPVP